MRNGVVFWQGYAQRFVLRRVRDADMEGEERYLIECFQSYLVCRQIVLRHEPLHPMAIEGLR